MQGLIANAVLAAFGARGLGFSPLSDDEVLRLAGVIPPPPSVDRLWSRVESRCKRAPVRCRVKVAIQERETTGIGQPATRLHLLLSDDPLPGGDIMVGTASVRALPGGRRQTVRVKARLPDETLPTGKYLILVDASGTWSPSWVHGPMR